MGRTFNGSSDYLKRATAVITAAPFTVAVWFKPTVGTAVRTLWSFGDTAGDSDYFRAVYDETAGRLDFQARHVSTYTASVTGTTEGAWNHAAMVAASSTSRTAYVNGTAGTPETTSVAPVSIDAVAVGRLERAAPVHYFGGDIAHFAIWNIALSGANISSLAAGANPQAIENANLVAYWTITGTASPEVDLINAYELAVTGTSASADNPTVDSYGGGGSTPGDGAAIIMVL